MKFDDYEELEELPDEIAFWLLGQRRGNEKWMRRFEETDEGASNEGSGDALLMETTPPNTVERRVPIRFEEWLRWYHEEFPSRRQGKNGRHLLDIKLNKIRDEDGRGSFFCSWE
ncbi:hypothetical protein MMC20_006780 [Loxospora ochrophaea]|nr:hypothetical protein [Loxospora ochrophaea]